MNIQMTNAQFAIWIAKQEAPQIQDEVAERIFRWLEKREKTSPQDPAILVDEINAIDKDNPFLKEYREKIDKANKQYFNINVPLK